MNMSMSFQLYYDRRGGIHDVPIDCKEVHRKL